MDIHTPKPWHDVREFLKEYLIIFVGVLTALVAEQIVEQLHVRREVAEAREALHDEIAANATLALFSIEEDRCLAQSLDAYARWAQGGPHAETFRGGFQYPRSSAWEEVRSGPVTHMPLKERLQLAEYYDELRNLFSVVDLERAAYLPLLATSQKPRLSAAEAQHLLEAVAQARLFGQVRTANLGYLLAATKTMNVQPHPMRAWFRQLQAWQCFQPGAQPPQGTPGV